MTAPIRRLGYLPEVPYAPDPVSANQLTRKAYVDAVALPTGGATDNILVRDSTDRLGKWLPPHLAAAPLATTFAGSGSGAAIDISSTVSAGGAVNVVMTTAGGITINLPTNGFDMLPVHYTILNSVGSTQNVTFHASFLRLAGLAAVNALPNGKIMRAVVRRTDISGSAQWILESVGNTQ